MPTRVVGTCCCGTPLFTRYERFWVQLDTRISTRSDGVDPWGRCMTYTMTPLGAIPSSFREIYYFPPSQWNPNGWSYGATHNTGEWDRTSRLSLGLSPNLNGGVDGDSLDPNDWVALFTNLSDESIDFSTYSGTLINLIGEPLSDIESLTSYAQFTSAWTRTFTHDGTTYRITFPAGTMLGRGPYYTKSITTDDDDYTSAMSWYMSYSIMYNGNYIERVASGSGSGNGSGGSGE